MDSGGVETGEFEIMCGNSVLAINAFQVAVIILGTILTVIKSNSFL